MNLEQSWLIRILKFVLRNGGLAYSKGGTFCGEGNSIFDFSSEPSSTITILLRNHSTYCKTVAPSDKRLLPKVMEDDEYCSNVALNFEAIILASSFDIVKLGYKHFLCYRGQLTLEL